jgi:hypothetical protein
MGVASLGLTSLTLALNRITSSGSVTLRPGQSSDLCVTRSSVRVLFRASQMRLREARARRGGSHV